MSSVAFHLARRGLSVAQELAPSASKGNGENPRIPVWGAVLLAATMVAFLAAIIAVCILGLQLSEAKAN